MIEATAASSADARYTLVASPRRFGKLRVEVEKTVEGRKAVQFERLLGELAVRDRGDEVAAHAHPEPDVAALHRVALVDHARGLRRLAHRVRDVETFDAARRRRTSPPAVVRCAKPASPDYHRVNTAQLLRRDRG